MAVIAILRLVNAIVRSVGLENFATNTVPMVNSDKTAKKNAIVKMVGYAIQFLGNAAVLKNFEVLYAKKLVQKMI